MRGAASAPAGAPQASDCAHGRAGAPRLTTARSAPRRVGRTARGRDGKGRALLMLMPEELGFLKYLKAAKVGLVTR